MLRVTALLIAGCLAVAGCTRAQEATAGGWIQADGSVVIPPAEREQAPPIEAETLDGQVVALSDLDGPVLVNFWASWCGPCAREAPHLAAVAEQFAPRGLQAIGVNVRDSRANARSFERDFDKPYPSWYDDASSIAAAFGGIGPAGLPSTILLDAQHRVAVRWFGAVTAMRISPHVEAILEEAGQPAAGAADAGERPR